MLRERHSDTDIMEREEIFSDQKLTTLCVVFRDNKKRPQTQEKIDKSLRWSFCHLMERALIPFNRSSMTKNKPNLHENGDHRPHSQQIPVARQEHIYDSISNIAAPRDDGQGNWVGDASGTTRTSLSRPWA